MSEKFKVHQVDLDANDQAAIAAENAAQSAGPQTKVDNYQSLDLSSVGELSPSENMGSTPKLESVGNGKFMSLSEQMTAASEGGKKFVGAAAERSGRFLNMLGSRVGAGATRGAELVSQGIDSVNTWESRKKEQMGALVQKGLATAELVKNGVKSKSTEMLNAGKQSLLDGFNGIKSFGRESVNAAKSAIGGVKERVRNGLANKALEMARVHQLRAEASTAEQQKWERFAASLQAKNALRSKFAERAANDNARQEVPLDLSGFQAAA